MASLASLIWAAFKAMTWIHHKAFAIQEINETGYSEAEKEPCSKLMKDGVDPSYSGLWDFQKDMVTRALAKAYNRFFAIYCFGVVPFPAVESQVTLNVV